MSDKITHRKKATRESIKNTAEKLHHTPAICKKSYIHNAVIDLYIEKPKKLYHIITDTGEFTIDSIKIKDYNSAIEDILDMRDKLFDLF